jgi:very-short-patch-repair endonuclease
MAKRYRSGASQWKVLKPWAREMRRAPTEAEAVLWSAIRGGAIHGLKFRRQHTVGRCVMDFFAAQPRVAVEVDGPIHDAQTIEDAERDQFLNSQGIRVLRLRNEDVLTCLPWVIEQIKSMCSSPVSPSSSSHSPQGGEGAGGEVVP